MNEQSAMFPGCGDLFVVVIDETTECDTASTPTQTNEQQTGGKYSGAGVGS